MLSLHIQRANEIVQEIHETHTVRGPHGSLQQMLENQNFNIMLKHDVHYENLASLILLPAVRNHL